MATTVPVHPGATRRLVLIDLDWQDADVLPDLLRQPGIAVSLVVGEGPENPGVRAAQMCGVPCTVELADLTREIFDLAVLGERSGRRAQVERLLQALGTPYGGPRTCLPGGVRAERRVPGTAPVAVRGDGASDIDAWMEEQLPGLAGPAAESETPAPGSDVPGPDDGLGLERALATWVDESGAVAAELHAGEVGGVRRVARFGPEDAMLGALVQLALQLDTAHVVGRLDGPQRGRVWAAWPFRYGARRGVVAAASIDPTEGRALWEHVAAAIQRGWERHGAPVTATLPGIAEPASLTRDGFRERVAFAVERHRGDGTRAALHRLHFPDAASVEALCAALPRHLRGGDCIVRSEPSVVLLLTGGSPVSFAAIRDRVLERWERAWSDAGHPAPAPPVRDERVELAVPDDAERFLGVAARWLGGV